MPSWTVKFRYFLTLGVLCPPGFEPLYRRWEYYYQFEHAYNAQCIYKKGHAYMVKNPMVHLLGPTTKCLWFWQGQNWNFPNKLSSDHFRTLGGCVLYFASLLKKIHHIRIYFLLMENAEVLMLKKSCILAECNFL